MCVKDSGFETLSQNFLVPHAGHEQQNMFHAPDSGMNLAQVAGASEEALQLRQGVQTVTCVDRPHTYTQMMAIWTSR